MNKIFEFIQVNPTNEIYFKLGSSPDLNDISFARLSWILINLLLNLDKITIYNNK